jgi:ABC-2 type transport system permease protein
MVSTGSRIAGERQVGWTRQLQIMPLTAPAYLRSKVVCAYAMAALTLGALYASGVILGVSLAIGDWLEMTGLIIVGLLPFAALGIALGHLLTVEAIGPAMGGTVSLLALVSGSWFPVTHGFLYQVGRVLPSYWLVQAGRVSLHGHGWGATAWLAVLGWTAALSVLAVVAYRQSKAHLVLDVVGGNAEPGGGVVNLVCTPVPG